MDTGLPWEGCIDAEVPINPKEREDAPLLLMPLCGSVKAIGDPGKNLPHYKLNPSAAKASELAAGSSSSFTHLILKTTGLLMNLSTFELLSL